MIDCCPVTRKLVNFRLWKIFVSAFADQFDEGLLYKRVHLNDQMPDLHLCLDHAMSPSHEWVTFLTLANIDCSRTDLVQLSRLVNLGMLTVSDLNNGHLEIEDSIIRAWSRAACEAGALTKFRILNCRSSSITGQIFSYLQELPALKLVIAKDVRYPAELDSQAGKYHWTTIEGANVGACDSVKMAKTWQNLYNDLTDHQTLEKHDESQRDKRPVLDLILGSTIYEFTVRMIDVKRSHIFRRTHPWNPVKEPSVEMPRLANPVSKKRKLRASYVKDLMAEWAT
ncbi:MAG: hypothetical protein Q9220_002095 [cf. Caloplaca sp. 1 TL-2023]